MTMLERMVEAKSWKASRGLAKRSKCRLCGQQMETVEQILAGCKVLANSEYILGSVSTKTLKNNCAH